MSNLKERLALEEQSDAQLIKNQTITFKNNESADIIEPLEDEVLKEKEVTIN